VETKGCIGKDRDPIGGDEGMYSIGKERVSTGGDVCM
jgi:hypothetical protein